LIDLLIFLRLFLSAMVRNYTLWIKETPCSYQSHSNLRTA